MSARQRIEAARSGGRRKSSPVRDMELEMQTSDQVGSDRGNILLLFALYFLQGIPLGLAASIPMMLQNRGASYKEQAEFSFVYWPFSLKLLWAPVVDSLYSTKFGRRKTWLIPIQYLIGFFMLVLSRNVSDFLDSAESGHPNVAIITIIFFCLNFLAATQDIAVDGWALTMLKRKNVGYASTCNSVGQTAGYFFGYVLFMALESPDFCNKYLRSEPLPSGIITLSGFLWFWGLVFLITTTLVGLLKAEKANRYEHEEDPGLDLKDSYLLLWEIIKLPSIRTCVVVLLTYKIGFSACDAVTGLKLVEAGIPKEQLALIAVPLVPLQIILPLIISKYTAGPRPMDVFLKAFPYRLLFGLVAVFMVGFTPYFVHHGEVSALWYAFLIVAYSFHQITVYAMYVAVMAFFAKVSDPAVGGTYMTLLNTLTNMGGNWPSTLALWFVDSLTFRSCIGGQLDGESCTGNIAKENCIAQSGTCVTKIDGYYIESVICIVIGFLWYWKGKHTVKNIQSRSQRSWKVYSNAWRTP